MSKNRKKGKRIVLEGIFSMFGNRVISWEVKLKHINSASFKSHKSSEGSPSFAWEAQPLLNEKLSWIGLVWSKRNLVAHWYGAPFIACEIQKMSHISILNVATPKEKKAGSIVVESNTRIDAAWWTWSCRFKQGKLIIYFVSLSKMETSRYLEDGLG